jgi:S-methylmethionine-dependent homocysteine/selenocysteine methylase
MSAEQAEAYHRHQIMTLADTSTKMVNAITMTYADEAAGIIRAAHKAKIPVSIGFTVETDGRLPDGTPLGEAIKTVDRATERVTHHGWLLRHRSSPCGVDCAALLLMNL